MAAAVATLQRLAAYLASVQQHTLGAFILIISSLPSSSNCKHHQPLTSTTPRTSAAPAVFSLSFALSPNTSFASRSLITKSGHNHLTLLQTCAENCRPVTTTSLRRITQPWKNSQTLRKRSTRHQARITDGGSNFATLNTRSALRHVRLSNCAVRQIATEIHRRNN